MQDDARTRRGRVTQVLHWATALLVLVAFSYGLGGSEQRVYLPARDFERQLHETLGLCVLALVVLRVLWRMFDTSARAEPSARWMALAAAASKVGLYALMFAVLLTAIAGAWLEGHSLTLLGGLEIAPPFGRSHDLGVTIANIHTVLGDAILWLAGLHAGAALYHHFVLRDRVLVAMLPRRIGVWRARQDQGRTR